MTRIHLITFVSCVLLAPPAAALGITLGHGQSGNVLHVTAGNGPDGDVLRDTLNPVSVPFVDSHSVSHGGSTSSSTYDFSDDGFNITFAHTRAPDPSTELGLNGAGSNAIIRFIVDRDVNYAISGSYTSVDAEGRGTRLNVGLSDTTSEARLFLSVSGQNSRSTPNESFEVGGSGGDFDNEDTGSLTGTLLAGRHYEFSVAASISAFPPPTEQAGTASGQVTLSFIPEPSTALLLGVGLVGVCVCRRGRYVRTPR
jgi:hypothetical protein